MSELLCLTLRLDAYSSFMGADDLQAIEDVPYIALTTVRGAIQSLINKPSDPEEAKVYFSEPAAYSFTLGLPSLP